MNRTDELIERIKDYIRVGRNRGWNEYADDLEALAASHERKREALQHYADEANWEHHASGVDGDKEKQYVAVCYDPNGNRNGFDVAREALKESAG